MSEIIEIKTRFVLTEGAYRKNDGTLTLSLHELLTLINKELLSLMDQGLATSGSINTKIITEQLL